jgi:ElaB/YqjD/DUF883 family membrane-anchored ribosome-binding protein
MDDEPEVIRQQMEVTRSSLTEKIEALEHKVVDTVQGTAAAVTNTVASVKDAVQTVKGSVGDTVQTVAETVRDTFDVRQHVARHPWASFGCSVAVGFAGGLLLGAGRRASDADRIRDLFSRGGVPYTHPTLQAALGGRTAERPADELRDRQSAPKPSGPGWTEKLGETFGPELEKLKGVALGAVFGLVRDLVQRAAPPTLSSQLSGRVDDVARKVGGQPLRGSLLDTGTASGKSSRERSAAGVGV